MALALSLESLFAARVAPFTAAFYRGPPRGPSGSFERGRSRLRRRVFSRDVPPSAPLPLGLSGRTQLVEDSPQVVHVPALQARDDRAVQPVQETRPAAASDEKGDEVASRSVVQNLHHAPLIRKAHTGVPVVERLVIENTGLIRILSCFPPGSLSE